MSKPRFFGLQQQATGGRASSILVMHQDWRERLLVFAKQMGIPVATRNAPWEQPDWPAERRLAAGQSFWRGGTCYLAAHTPDGPVEWLYMFAQYGIALAAERQLDDLGFADRHPNDRLAREARVRRLTIAWCIQSGMTPESLSEFLWAWAMTPITQATCRMPGEVRWNMKHHTTQCIVQARDCVAWAREMGTPEPPLLWYEEYFSFPRNETRGSE